MSVKVRLIYAFVIAVLTTTIAMGLLSFFQARSVMLERTTKTELPAQIAQIKNEVENQIETLSINAEILANNPMILDWAKKGFTKDGETSLVALLSSLRERLGLDVASWADRKSGKYWNQDGFLRVMAKETDSWFFDFTSSSKSKNVSVYRSKSTGEVSLFVNYQNLNGQGLAGFGMKLTQMTNYLNSFNIGDGGFVYLVSQEGVVKVHRNGELLEKSNLTDLYGAQVGQALLVKEGVNIQMTGSSVLASQFIPAMGWILVAEIPNEAVFGSVSDMGHTLLILGIILSIVAAVAASFIGATLVRQLGVVADNLKEIGEGNGDLSHRLSADGPVELADIGNGFNKFVIVIHNMVKQVLQTSSQLNQASEQMSNSAETILKDARLQSDRTSMVVSAVHEMEMSVREVSENAAEAATSAQDVNREVNEGLKVADSAKIIIENLSSESERIASTVADLAKNSEQIGSILEVIRSISEQTNLLALNAAIESARAGEQGRGFAVVADEVRNLAKRTAQSTDEIQVMIDKLQSESRKALSASQAGQEKASEGAESVKSVALALNTISSQVDKMNALNQQVAATTEQQLLAMGDVGQNITSIQDSVNHSVITANGLTENSKSLRTLSVDLETLVARFKV
ncbi:methyl-accepting chemotaxis protein [Marinomonas sp. 15G1-11]|uniref:Methyl-accepting chemotaxis protein n=1 Tax=Marinomonas phaeophyticola TaxID=3004091 RepID=A0ABT4JWS3_9GAMM|nr:methyl-accepting chemotaxis protein [Marinomonas sp. 15G1-11]MCZ2722024.1 methyl-accepting chemotaxis protein [Marinomonas sp. 15G1-11]